MKDILALRLYTRVARLGSFSAAAREAGLAQSQVSRMVADLELSLGAKLLTRTTRAVVMTEAGIEFLTRAEPILVAIEDAENSVRESGDLRGRLRVGMTTTMGLRVVAPRLEPFSRQHPNLKIELILEDRWQDMVREAVDIGIRVGPLPDSAGTSRLMATIPRLVVASPRYLEQSGTPATPDELINHWIIGSPSATTATEWQFNQHGTKSIIKLESHISNNSIAGTVACASGGLGIALVPLLACRREIQSGTLCHILRKWNTTDVQISAFFPMGRATRKVARAFVEYITIVIREEAHIAAE
jgi:DNA-binding transcriptional LysR family regulator